MILSCVCFISSTDPETQEEPNDLQLLALAYCPNGQWIDTEKECVYVSIILFMHLVLNF
jgi:hypothetical protein